MKKLLGSVLAIAMLVQPGMASAELLKNFKLSGGVDLQTQASRNVMDFVTRQAEFSNDVNPNGWVPSGDQVSNTTERPTFNDRTNDAQFRVIVNMDWDLLDDVHAKVTLRKNDRAWGNGAATVQRPAGTPYQTLGDNAVGIGGGANILGAIALDQAYVKVDKVFGHLDATLGRQYYGEPGDLVIYYGPRSNMYGLSTDAIDALRVDVYSAPYFNITGLAGKTAAGAMYSSTGFAFAQANTDVRGLVFTLKDVENVNLDAFVYNRVIHNTGPLGTTGEVACVDGNADGDTTDAGECVPGNFGMNDSLYVYGLKGKVNFAGFTGKMQFAKNAGKNRNPGTLNWDTQQDGNTTADNTFRIPGSGYEGWAWTVDGEYKAEVEDVASFTPWFTFNMGTGRNSIADSKNAGFTSINSDFRPGTIYGRFGTQLGSMIPCALGAMGCTAADIDGDANNFTAGAGRGEGLGVRTAGTHMGASNIGAPGLNNRVIWGAGLKVTPAFANKLTVAISVWDFRFQKITDDKVIWVDPGTWANTYTQTAAGAAIANGQPGANFPNGVARGTSLTFCNTTSCYARLPSAGADTNNLDADANPATGVGNYFSGLNNTQGFSNGHNQKHIGNELDIDLTWKHSDNVTFQAGIASFRPGKYIQEMIADNYNINSSAAVNTSITNTGTGMRVANNPVVMAYGDMHIKF